MRFASSQLSIYLKKATNTTSFIFLLCALCVFVVKPLLSAEAPVSFRATNAKLESDYPCLAWTGSTLGAAWMDGRDGNEEIYFRPVAPAARTLGPEVRLTDSANWDYQPQLVWNGSNFGLLWMHERKEKRDVYFIRLSESGGKIGSPVRIVNQAMIEKPTRLAWTGRGYGAVWTDYRPGNPEIFFSPLSASGQPAGSPVRVTEGQGMSEPGALLWTGSSFALVYLDSRDGAKQVYFTRLAETGARLGPEQKLSTAPGDCTTPALAWNGNALAAVWTQPQSGSRQLMAAIMSGAGAIRGAGDPTRAPLQLTSDPSDKIQAAVAASPAGFGLSFWARTGPSRVLQFLFLPASGPPSAARSLTPARRAEGDLQASTVCPFLTMAFDGAAFDIGWVDLKEEMNSEIYITRVKP